MTKSNISYWRRTNLGLQLVLQHDALGRLATPLHVAPAQLGATARTMEENAIAQWPWIVAQLAHDDRQVHAHACRRGLYRGMVVADHLPHRSGPAASREVAPNGHL